MNSLIFAILVFIITSIISSRKAARKLLADVEDETMQSTQEFVEPELEQDMVENFLDEEISENYNSTPSSIVEEPKRKNKPTVKAAAVAESKEQDNASFDFDLRSAVIYQTILHNDYISEAK